MIVEFETELRLAENVLSDWCWFKLKDLDWHINYYKEREAKVNDFV